METRVDFFFKTTLDKQRVLSLVNAVSQERWQWEGLRDELLSREEVENTILNLSNPTSTALRCTRPLEIYGTSSAAPSLVISVSRPSKLDGFEGVLHLPLVIASWIPWLFPLEAIEAVQAWWSPIQDLLRIFAEELDPLCGQSTAITTRFDQPGDYGWDSDWCWEYLETGRISGLSEFNYFGRKMSEEIQADTGNSRLGKAIVTRNGGLIFDFFVDAIWDEFSDTDRDRNTAAGRELTALVELIETRLRGIS